jgi:hypothetical protein
MHGVYFMDDEKKGATTNDFNTRLRGEDGCQLPHGAELASGRESAGRSGDEAGERDHVLGDPQHGNRGRQAEAGTEACEKEGGSREMTIQTKSAEFLYTPPPAAHRYEPELLAWHKRMSAEYKLVKGGYPPKVLYQWLRKASIHRDQMDRWGITVSSYGNYPSYSHDAYTSIFDHAHVIKRRSDGKVFILGEPYSTVAKVESNPCVKAWRELGSTVVCSNETGWFPCNTVSVLIGQPR